jgi:pimeloyl-ACP methyl ester carboxylesterase
VFGRGLGAFVALMLAGSRPKEVVGAVLADGPGLAGGPTFPTSQSFVALPPHEGPPDPYALIELTRDLRPPDYAAAFARLALAGSPLDEPITVSAVFRPPWLEAVAGELGVAHRSIGDALAAYARA